ncbi:MAG: FkbM family methyltransferase [Candidatus Pacebacteria bacterium]|nr:FkbM family methyltransferase [Candidatus Paceibacterota bacterium]
MKKVIKKFISKKNYSAIMRWKNIFFNDYAIKSYSQEGEDMILRRLFETKKNGFYIDVGAHHPKRFSNTYYFYKIGWRGINIDAMPGSMKLFNKIRPRDINLEEAVSDKIEKLTYHIFNEPALSGFSEELITKRDGKNDYHVIDTIDLKAKTLSEILERYILNEQDIDFLNVDAEGFDYRVLAGNDWQKFHPKVILFEELNSVLLDKYISPSRKLLEINGYIPYAKTVNTVFFIDKNYYNKLIKNKLNEKESKSCKRSISR